MIPLAKVLFSSSVSCTCLPTSISAKAVCEPTPNSHAPDTQVVDDSAARGTGADRPALSIPSTLTASSGATELVGSPPRFSTVTHHFVIVSPAARRGGSKSVQ